MTGLPTGSLLTLALAALLAAVVAWALRQAASARQRAAEVRAARERLADEAAARVRAERNFARLFAAAPDFVMIVRLADGTVADLNPSLEHHLGHAREDVLGRTPADAGLFADLDAAAEWVARLRDGESLPEREAVLRTGAGAERTCLLSAETIDVEGEPHGVIRARDITELKRTQRSLESQLTFEQQLSSISRSFARLPADETDAGIDEALAEIGSWLGVDRCGLNQLSADRRTFRATHVWLAEGIPDDPALGENVIFELVPAKAAHVLAGEDFVFDDTRDMPEAWEGERAYVESLGIRSTAQVPLSIGGEIVGDLWLDCIRHSRTWEPETVERLRLFAEIIANALKRQRVEATVREAWDFTRSALDAQNDLFLVFDFETGVPARWNRAFAERAGCSDEEIAARKAPDAWCRPDQVHLAHAALDEARREGSAQVDLDLVTKDGGLVPIDFRLSVLTDEGGVPTHSIVVGRDVTERREMERQLLHSQKMEAIGRLAGGVAHDLNNVLMVVKGYVELAQQRLGRGAGDPAPVVDSLAQIDGASDRAAALTRQLLTFGRRDVVKPVVLSVGDVLAELERMLRRLVRENIEIDVVVPPGLSPIRGDVGRVEQVLVNLVINASDAMPDGGRLHLEARDVRLDEAATAGRPDAHPGSYVCLRVTDTGHGIDEDDVSRVFEPFFTTKPVGEGTGLGLATVHGIVHDAGGHIRVESAVGRGTTFEVFWPATEEPAARPSAGSDIAEAPRGAATVLVCEDDPEIAELLRTTLEAAGYSVLAARHPQSALEAATAHDGTIDLIVSDFIMPGMNGVELARAIREERPGVPLVLISGYVDALGEVAGLADEDFELFTKPFSPVELIRRIQRVLAEDPPDAAGEPPERPRSPDPDRAAGPHRTRSPGAQGALRALLVEDDAEVVRLLEEQVAAGAAPLRELEVCGTVRAARAAFSRDARPDVVVMDVDLPDGNGFDLVGEMRAAGDPTPVLMLTSLAAEADIVRGLEVGADDYLTKPFHFGELWARLGALVRRSRTTTLRWEDVELDRVGRSVTRAGAAVKLTPVQFKLLETLMEDPERLVSTDELRRRVWGLDFDPGTTLVRTHVSALRKRLEEGGGARVVGNVPGKGYRLTRPS